MLMNLILYSYYGYNNWMRGRGVDAVTARLFACMPTIYYLTWVGIGLNRMAESICQANNACEIYLSHARTFQWFIIAIGIPSFLIGTFFLTRNINRAAEIYARYRSIKYYKVVSMETFFLLLLPILLFVMWDSGFIMGLTIIAHGCFMFFGGSIMLRQLRN